MADSPFHPRYIPTWIGLGLLRILALLPIPWQLAIGKTLGQIMARLLKRRRHITEVNIRLCFPEFSPEEQENLVDRSFEAMAMGVMESGMAWWGSDRSLRAVSRMDGMELIEAAQKEGRGILLFGAHFSSIELSGRMCTLHMRASATYQHQKNRAFDYVMQGSRRRYIDQLIHKREMRKMIRSLRDGNIVWYAPDQDFGREGSVFAPFFGKPAATLATAGQLLSLTGARPLFYRHHRELVDGKVLYLGEISDPFQDGFGKDELANATLFNRALEEAIRIHPEQYLWAHERFRTREKPDDPRVYILRKKKPKRTARGEE
jgi:KDO2-lipid IV(A) lauroyltransferase